VQHYRFGSHMFGYFGPPFPEKDRLGLVGFESSALNPLWDTYLAVLNPTGALDGKTKQLIALAVSAQIPCAYCVYATTKAAKAAGATDAQMKEAIATAAVVRFNSTMLNGSDGGRDADTVFTSK
jgi:AhpD family alkylhydroperoxidase